MKTNPVVYALLVISFYVSGCTHKLAPQGHYQDTPVVADGNTNDWSVPLRFSNEKYTFQYNITNDSKFIYICILSTDDATQLRILKNGMTIYFDPKGKKNKDISIAFPLLKTDDENSYNRKRNRNGNPIKPSDETVLINKLTQQVSYFETKGFLNIENGQFGIADTRSHIKVAIKYNNDSVLVYEAIIPINIITGSDLTEKQAAKNFSVCVTLNAVLGQEGDNGNSSRPSFGGGMRGGMMGGGMHMGGGMRGGGGRNSNSQRTQGSKEEDTWYQFRLADKKG